MVDFGAGSLEDMLPFLVHVYQTVKNLVKRKEKLFSFIKQKYEKHKESFNPSVYSIILFTKAADTLLKFSPDDTWIYAYIHVQGYKFQALTEILLTAFL